MTQAVRKSLQEARSAEFVHKYMAVASTLLLSAAIANRAMFFGSDSSTLSVNSNLRYQSSACSRVLLYYPDWTGIPRTLALDHLDSLHQDAQDSISECSTQTLPPRARTKPLKSAWVYPPSSKNVCVHFSSKTLGHPGGHSGVRWTFGTEDLREHGGMTPTHYYPIDELGPH